MPNNEKLQSLDENQRGLRAEFQWRHDRYALSLWVVEPGNVTPAWWAVDEVAVQQLHEQRDAAGNPVLYLIGSSYGCHWSMSIHAPEAAVLEFDMACRLLKDPVLTRDEYGSLLMKGPAAERVRILPAEESTLIIMESDKLTIRPQQPELSENSTLCWKFQVSRSS